MNFSTLLLLLSIGLQSFGLSDRLSNYVENVELVELKQSEAELEEESSKNEVDGCFASSDYFSAGLSPKFLHDQDRSLFIDHDQSFPRLRGPPSMIGSAS